VIIRSGQIVRGLTTAACLWMVAGVGMAVGIGLYAPAVMVAVVAMFNLLFLKQIERLIKKDHFFTLVIHSSTAKENQENVKNIIQENKMRIVNERIEKDTTMASSRYEYTLSTKKAFDQEAFIGAFLMFPDIQKVSIY
jgi:putative Mg2+ transporter-C (MgtC) family protein